ncbi:hypothetical protein C8F04DRAFT_1194343 [Mycena alexandri]|uniref:Uncharacterized protein n=1 Tax=Mycena alexandri TaxID=1745969 RepID=A0AAD6S7L0_9AGAR|nr:hypothetical protein C8F04DRAFT_1194343 [Mycena alexandri]
MSKARTFPAGPMFRPMGTPAPTAVPKDLQAQVDQALHPRYPTETDAEYQHRAHASGESKRRAAAAFPVDQAAQSLQAPIDRPFKSARFEDSSISAAGRRAVPPLGPTDGISTARPPRTLGPADSISTAGGISFGPAVSGFDNGIGTGITTIDALEAFAAEAQSVIRSIVHRSVGEELASVPPRVRSPKLDNPSKFSGVNNHTQFIQWLEELTTWMRASFMGGDGCANYRITVLKTYLTGNALQWFADYVEPRVGQSTIPYEFASILCAMHRRFITAATAQKASREFEAVRYKAEDGPLKLMDDLVDASSRMREPMPDFIIRQRFMKLIPENIRSLMVLHHALSAEYSDSASLRFHSNQIWDAYNNAAKAPQTFLAATNPTNPPRPTPRPNAAMPARREVAKVAPAGPTTTAVTKPVAAMGAVPNSNNATKHCFKCGEIGHIGSDPICRYYNNFPPAEDDQVDDNWGGSQFDPEDIEEAVPTEPQEGDLVDLIDLADEATPRMGAMGVRYFSMRVEVPVAPLSDQAAEVGLTPLQEYLFAANIYEPANRPRSIENVYGPSAMIDMARIAEHRERNGETPLSEEAQENLRRELVLSHEYPVSKYTSFDEETYRYHLLHDGTGASEDPDEWAIILALGAAESCREEADAVLAGNRGAHVAVSTQQLDYHMDSLVRLAEQFVEPINHNKTLLQAARDIARVTRDGLREAPSTTNAYASGRLRDLRDLGLDILEVTHDAMEAAAPQSATQVRRLEALQSVVVEEMRIRRATGDLEGGNAALNASEIAGSEMTGSPPALVSPTPSNSTFNPDASPPLDTTELPSTTLGNPSAATVIPGWSGNEVVGGPPVPWAPRSNSPTLLTNADDALDAITAQLTRDGRRSPGPSLPLAKILPALFWRAELRWIYGNNVEEYVGPSNSELYLGESDDEREIASSTIPRESDQDSPSAEPSESAISGPPTVGPSEAPNASTTTPDCDDDEVILQSIVSIMGTEAAERFTTYVDRHGTLYVRPSPLPDTHYLSPAMVNAHKTALEEAIQARAEELHCSPAIIRSQITWAPNSGNHYRQGFLDTEPRLMPGTVYHERVASLGPDHDDTNALPGHRIQTLTQRIEHLASVNRPDGDPQVGITDQPKRDINAIACLTAELNIGGVKAYMLFDTGSNTDSLTPEFARSSNCTIFRLAEQVTLQLGCVGSRAPPGWRVVTPSPWTPNHVEEVEDEDDVAARHRRVLPLSDPRVLELEEVIALETPGALSAQSTPLHPPQTPWRPTLTEVDDEEDVPTLPCLPPDYPVIMELEGDCYYYFVDDPRENSEYLDKADDCAGSEEDYVPSPPMRFMVQHSYEDRLVFQQGELARDLPAFKTEPRIPHRRG